MVLAPKLQEKKIFLQPGGRSVRGVPSTAREIPMSRVRTLRHCLIAALASSTVLGCLSAQAANPHGDPAQAFATTTPIKHLVVIFQENVSFDHYFGTYPKAANPAGEPAFQARRDTPSVNGLNDFLLNHNPNSANPQRLDRSEALTCDQGHGY